MISNIGLLPRGRKPGSGKLFVGISPLRLMKGEAVPDMAVDLMAQLD